MPCWEVNIYSVEFKAENRSLLKKALNEVNENIVNETSDYVVTRNLEIDFINKKAVDTSFDPQRAKVARINKLKQTYSRLAVMEAAKKNKWAVRPVTKTKLQAVRYA